MKRIKVDAFIRFIVALFIVGIVMGIVYFMLKRVDSSIYLEKFIFNIKNKAQNSLFESILGISLVFVLSSTLIGIPIVLFYILYEGLSIGFTLGMFLNCFKIKGSIFYLLFILVSKIIYIVTLLLYSSLSLKFSYKFIESIINKDIDQVKRSIVNHFYRFLIFFLVVLGNSICVYLFSNKIMCFFLNLIE